MHLIDGAPVQSGTVPVQTLLPMPLHNRTLGLDVSSDCKADIKRRRLQRLRGPLCFAGIQPQLCLVLLLTFPTNVGRHRLRKTT
jgi:hypothetical protein